MVYAIEPERPPIELHIHVKKFRTFNLDGRTWGSILMGGALYSVILMTTAKLKLTISYSMAARH